MAKPARLIPTLKKRREFLQQRHAARYSGKVATLQGTISPCASSGSLCDHSGQLRVGYTVSKKNGGAVDRNRIKRRLRHAFAQAVEAQAHSSRAGATGRGGGPGAICGDVVIIARRDALREPYDRLTAELAKGIDRLLAKGKKAATGQ